MNNELSISSRADAHFAGKKKRSVFRDLLLSMISFGTVVGLLFPPFARIVLSSEHALSVQFFVLCVSAGVLVGMMNYLLFDRVVSRELNRLVKSMSSVVDHVADAESQGSGCRSACQLEITSQDAIGDIQESFNTMTDAISRRLNKEATLRTMNARLSASVDLKEVAQIVLSSFAEACSTKAGMIYGNSGSDLTLLASFGIDHSENTPVSLNQKHGPGAHALEKDEILSFSTDSGSMNWISLSTPFGTFQPQSVLVIPLLVKQQPVGLVFLACGNCSLSPETTDLLNFMRGQAAPYLANAFLHQKITDLAAIDELTHILNRRFGLMRLNEEFNRSLRHGVPVSVIMIDIDYFKHINDAFGHAAGDQIISAVAAEIASNLRSGDMLCRFGGDEFLLVIPGTGQVDSARLGEKLRFQIEKKQIEHGGYQLSVTVSVGIATWPMIQVSRPDELVNAADQALYGAKQWGRNCIAVWSNNQPKNLASVEREAVIG